MTEMSGGQAVVRSLTQHGIDTIFGLPGVQLDHLFNAFHDAGNELRVINARHEQGVAYMALGAALATGKPACYAVVPGPGILNTTAALATAYGCNAPVFCVAGQITTASIGRGSGQLHEIPDQLAILRGLTKWAERAQHPTEIPDLVRTGFSRMLSGRTRPVAIEVPLDVLARKSDVTLGGTAEPLAPPEPDADAIDAAAKLLGQAENPVIFVGGGIFGAEAELRELAERLQAPVVLTRAAGGALDDRDPLAQRQLAGHELWGKADVVLGVGTRLFPMVPAWGLDAKLKVIRLDIDPVEVTRNAMPAVSIVASAQGGLAALLRRLPAHERARPKRADALRDLKARADGTLRQKLAPQMAWVDALRAALPEDGILVEELTQVGYVARVGFPVHVPRGYITSGYQGTLGGGFATALGVKVARPDKAVLSICGDGGFMFTMPELATAVHHGIGLVTVVFDDGAYGNVRRMQQEDHGGRVIATALTNPDFVRLAESFGAAGERAETPEALIAAIRRGFERAGPTLISVPLGPTPDPWKTLAPGRAR